MKDRFGMLLGFNFIILIVFIIVIAGACLWTLSFDPLMLLFNKVSSGGMTLWHSILVFEVFILVVSFLD